MVGAGDARSVPDDRTLRWQGHRAAGGLPWPSGPPGETRDQGPRGRSGEDGETGRQARLARSGRKACRVRWVRPGLRVLTRLGGASWSARSDSAQPGRPGSGAPGPAVWWGRGFAGADGSNRGWGPAGWRWRPRRSRGAGRMAGPQDRWGPVGWIGPRTPRGRRDQRASARNWPDAQGERHRGTEPPDAQCGSKPAGTGPAAGAGAERRSRTPTS